MKPRTTHKILSIQQELKMEREHALKAQQRDQDDYRHFLDEQIMEKKQRKQKER